MVLLSHLRDREAETEGRRCPSTLGTPGAQLGPGLRSCFGTWSRTLSTLLGVIIHQYLKLKGEALMRGFQVTSSSSMLL